MRRVLRGVFALLLAGCVSPSAPEEALVLTPLQSEVTRGERGLVLVGFRVSNPGQQTMYLPTCGGVVTADVQYRAAPAVAWLESAQANLCYSSFAAGPRTLEPGGSVEGRSEFVLPPGEYRLQLAVSATRDAEPSRSVVSSPFVVR